MEQMERVIRLALRKKTIVIFGLSVALAVGTLFNHVVREHIDAWIGVVAALAVIPAVEFIDVVVQYRRFHRLEGSYVTHGYVRENKNVDEVCVALSVDEVTLEQEVDKNPDLTYPTNSTATITYEGDTSIKVTVLENNPPKNNKWVGKCIMESDEVGIMSWAYEHLWNNPEPWTRSGIKRLSVVSADAEPLKLSLFTYNDGRFGAEMLTKVDTRKSIWPLDRLLSLFWLCASSGILAIRLVIKSY